MKCYITEKNIFFILENSVFDSDGTKFEEQKKVAALPKILANSSFFRQNIRGVVSFLVFRGENLWEL